MKFYDRDNFLNFWFRFIYRNRTSIEMENFSHIMNVVKRDFSTYCGPLLERFFQKLLAETGNYNEIGSYWEKHNQNEIDVVAINDMKKIILIAETKLNKTKINLNELDYRSTSLRSYFPDYVPTYRAFGIMDSIEFICK